MERVQYHRKEKGGSFRQAEADLGDVANHERVGRLMLLNSHLGSKTVDVVGRHHDPGDDPGQLICLVHMANNLAKDLGLGYLPGEEGQYDSRVLTALDITQKQVENFRDSLATDVASEIRTVVDQCI